MSGNTIRRMPPGGEGEEPNDGDYLSPEEDFARRLHYHMQERGLSNSDLARAVWGEKRNARGYMEAKGRDRISVYLKGQTMPEARTLKQLSDALGVTENDLCPEHTRRALAWEPQSVSLNVAPGHPDKGRLVIDRIVPFALAAEIIRLLAEHDKQEDR